MTESEFILALQEKLDGLPWDEVEERLSFYSEMIKDRMEEGLSEEEAVAEIGLVDEVAGQIIADIPLGKIAKERIKSKRRLSAWEIVLLAVGSPIWFSLVVSAAAVIFSVYVSVWSVVISVWAVFVSLAASALACVASGIGMLISGSGLVGAVVISAGLICAGFSIFSFFSCKAASKGMVWLTQKLLVWIKGCFLKRRVKND